MLEQEHKYIRDSHSKAAINTDVDALRRYKARKAESKRILDLKNEVDSIKDEMSEIKHLLTQLVDNQIR
jgi:protein subunit release factor A